MTKEVGKMRGSETAEKSEGESVRPSVRSSLLPLLHVLPFFAILDGD